MNTHQKTFATIGILAILGICAIVLATLLLIDYGKLVREDLYYKGLSAYVAGDYQTAVAQFRKAADKGNLNAMRSLGQCYRDGDGVKQDYSEAVKWFKMAAKKSDVNSMVSLGRFYYDGAHFDFYDYEAHFERDYGEAVKWFRMAAEKGDAEAMYYLGECYESGFGVNMDLDEAVKWYRQAANGNGDYLLVSKAGEKLEYLTDAINQVKNYREAAEKGDAEAMCRLASCYKIGKGVKMDLSEAVKWFQKSVNGGYEEAQSLLDSLTREMNKSKRYREAAEKGDAEAMFELARRYYFGDGVEESGEEVDKWLRKWFDTLCERAGKGDTEAMLELARHYENGWGLKRNEEEAVKWLSKRFDTLCEKAGKGDAEAMRRLGVDYLLMESPSKAAKWFLKAAENGNVNAMYEIGFCCEEGCGVEKDEKEAFKWYRMAAEKGHEDAMYKLAGCYHYGIGVERDSSEAAKWLRNAGCSKSQIEAELRRETGGFRRPYVVPISPEDMEKARAASCSVESLLRIYLMSYYGALPEPAE